MKVSIEHKRFQERGICGQLDKERYREIANYLCEKCSKHFVRKIK